MKRVVRFEAKDGTEFLEEAACSEYERLCAQCATIEARLRPYGGRGEEWVQQDPETVLDVQRELAEIYETLRPGNADAHTIFAKEAKEPVGMSLIGRYIDDGGPRPLRRAWHRLCKMDRNFREYEQPYYAIQANRQLPPLTVGVRQ